MLTFASSACRYAARRLLSCCQAAPRQQAGGLRAGVFQGGGVSASADLGDAPDQAPLTQPPAARENTCFPSHTLPSVRTLVSAWRGKSSMVSRIQIFLWTNRMIFSDILGMCLFLSRPLRIVNGVFHFFLLMMSSIKHESKISHPLEKTFLLVCCCFPPTLYFQDF